MEMIFKNKGYKYAISEHTAGCIPWCPVLNGKKKAESHGQTNDICNGSTTLWQTEGLLFFKWKDR